MIKHILLYGDLALQSQSHNVEKNEDVSNLVEDLFETMHRANGIGLAAIQIGVPLRIFVVEAHIEEENFHFREVFINPNIIRKFGETTSFTEGCLSIPMVHAPISREENIEIEWYDENWNYKKEVFSGYKSRIIQHEYDHLDGKLYIDHLKKMWISMMDPTLNLIKEREIELPYLTK